MHTNPEIRDHYNILSIAGGNDPFAIFAPTIIARLQHQQPFLDNTQVYTGTSAGALVALALASELDPTVAVAKARRLIMKFAELQPNLIVRLGRLLEKFAWDPFQMITTSAMWMQVLFTPLYEFTELKQVLEDEFGDETLGHLAAKGRFVVIPSFRLDGANRTLETPTWKPRIFQNLVIKNHSPNFDFRLVDVALTAIPDPNTFPIFKGRGALEGHYIDGYVYAMNPSLTAITYILQAMKKIAPEKLRPIEDHFSVLSVGSCWSPDFYLNVKDSGNWGIFQWMVSHPSVLLKLVNSAGYISSLAQATTLLTRSFCHIDQLITRMEPNYYELDSSLTEARKLAQSVDLRVPKLFVSKDHWVLPEPPTKPAAVPPQPSIELNGREERVSNN